jgi:pimeloyl-ACP methyl ester carboxylesterase
MLPRKRLPQLPRKRLLQTPGGRLEHVLSGQGRPHWIFFSGAGVPLEGWRWLYPELETLGTVLAWNRFGLGRSDPPPGAQTGSRVLASLRELLVQCGLGPPYVLVAHSLGALHAQLFARLYPAEVAAVALIEPSHPDDATHGRGQESRLASAIARMLPFPTEWLRGNLDAELACAADMATQVKSAGPFPCVPLLVITGTRPPPRWLGGDKEIGRRQALHARLAALSPGSRHLFFERSGHFPQRTETARVLEALRALAHEATGGQPQAARPCQAM